MAATVAGALKALLEGAGLGVSVYRQRSPQDAVLPYITVDEAVAMVDELHGDKHDEDAHAGVDETLTVHVWQRWRTDQGRPAEQYDLPDAVWRIIKTAQPFTFGTPPRVVYGLGVDGRARLVEDEANVVHDAFTVRARRDV